MNLGEAKDLVTALLGVESRVGAFRDAVLNKVVNMACRMVWGQMAQYCRDRLCTDVIKTYPADAADVAVSTSASISSVVYCGRLQTSDPVSASNRPTPLFPSTVEEIESVGVSQASPYIPPEYAQYRYALLGDVSLTVRPIPTEDIHLFVRYVAVPETLALDASALFGGDMEDFHDLVVLRTAALLAVRAGIDAKSWDDEAYRLWTRLVDSLKGSTQMPSGVRHVTAHYD